MTAILNFTVQSICVEDNDLIAQRTEAKKERVCIFGIVVWLYMSPLTDISILQGR